MFYSPYYRSPYSFYPYYGGGSYGYAPFGGYGGYGSYYGINSIGSQFSNQSLVNTGSMIGSSQIQSPINMW